MAGVLHWSVIWQTLPPSLVAYLGTPQSQDSLGCQEGSGGYLHYGECLSREYYSCFMYMHDMTEDPYTPVVSRL